MKQLALILTLIASALWSAPTAQADEEIVLGLSQDKVAITAQFDGSDILIFGAVKRETAIPDSDLDVIIAIQGPTGPVTVRRKEKKFGIWINGAALEVNKAPAFYAVASSAPLGQILRRIETERYAITIDRAIQSVSATVHFGNTQAFTRPSNIAFKRVLTTKKAPLWRGLFIGNQLPVLTGAQFSVWTFHLLL